MQGGIGGREAELTVKLWGQGAVGAKSESDMQGAEWSDLANSGVVVAGGDHNNGMSQLQARSRQLQTPAPDSPR